jgi:hypothetical protein
MHPVTYEWFASQFPASVQSLGAMGMFSGIQVFSNKHLPIWHKKWEFPRTPFVEYKKSDEDWARKIGFGREVDDIGNYYVVGLHERRVKFDPTRLDFFSDSRIDHIRDSIRLLAK